jgi:AcrR family transcriptional regulator
MWARPHRPYDLVIGPPAAKRASANQAPQPLGRGRPRSAQAEASILATAIELLLEQGFEAMSMGQLAERAGVGKGAIYRRWRSKLEVVIAALSQLAPPQPQVPDTGSLLDDLLEVARMRFKQGERSGRFLLLPRLVPELRSNPQLRGPFVEHVLAPARAPVRAIFERAIERGELRAELDPDLALDLVAGPLIYRLLIGDDIDQVIANAPSVIQAILEGIGAPQKRTTKRSRRR